MTTTQLESRVSELESEVAALKEKLDYAEAVAGIQRGLDQINHGLGRPAIEIVRELRAKFNLPNQ